MSKSAGGRGLMPVSINLETFSFLIWVDFAFFIHLSSWGPDRQTDRQTDRQKGGRMKEGMDVYVCIYVDWSRIYVDWIG